MHAEVRAIGDGQQVLGLMHGQQREQGLVVGALIAVARALLSLCTCTCTPQAPLRVNMQRHGLDGGKTNQRRLPRCCRGW